MSQATWKFKSSRAHHGLVAQLARAPHSHCGGREFKSLPAHQTLLHPTSVGCFYLLLCFMKSKAKAIALAIILVEHSGFEPLTSSLPAKRSSQMS